MKPLPQAALESCACPLCGEEEQKSTPYRSDSVQVVRCAACELWYLSPRPTAEWIAEEYAKGAYFEGDDGGESGYNSYELQAKALRATFRRLMRALHRQQMTGGSLLEVGCGYGYLLEAAATYFDTCVGCDLSADAAARVKSADEVYVGGAKAVPADRKFNCVIATHVVEHVHDPIPFVQELGNRLSNGGWLVLAAPDMGSAWRKLMKTRWPSFKYPEHVVFYDRESLSRLLREAELTHLKRIPYSHAFPLSLVCAKLGLKGLNWLDSFNLWLPATTVAVAGQRVQEVTP